MQEHDTALAAEAKTHGGLLRRLLRRAEHEAAEPKKDASSTLKLEDIQGFILRGYRMPMVRHFLLKVTNAGAASTVLGRLVSGNEADAPQITTAENWHVGFEPGPRDNLAEPPRYKPDYCLNVGITWPGLVALQVKDRVPNLAFKSFGAFIAGAAARAELVGDTGPSAPQNWLAGFWQRRRSCPGHAARHESRNHSDSQRSALRTVCRWRRIPRTLAW